MRALALLCLLACAKGHAIAPAAQDCVDQVLADVAKGDDFDQIVSDAQTWGTCILDAVQIASIIASSKERAVQASVAFGGAQHYLAAHDAGADQ